MTSDTTKRIKALAKHYGFKLIRQNKHLVFRNNEGVQFVTSASASDVRALKNIESTIKKLVSNHDNSNHTI